MNALWQVGLMNLKKIESYLKNEVIAEGSEYVLGVVKRSSEG